MVNICHFWGGGGVILRGKTFPVADPDLQVRGEGGGGLGPVSPNFFFDPSGLSLVKK